MVGVILLTLRFLHDIWHISIYLPLQFKNVYSELKAQAEATVLLANDMDGLLTCALRPSNVFGPGDKKLLPSLVDVAKSSWAKVWNSYRYLTKLCALHIPSVLFISKILFYATK